MWKNFSFQGELAGPLIKYPAVHPTTAAAIAARDNDVQTLRNLPAQECDARDESGNTPLIWAADAGSVESVRFLLQTGVSVNSKGYLEATAVSRACRRGHVLVLKELLSAPGVDCDIPNVKKQYPLHFATFRRHREIVQMCLEFGASTYVLDRKGRTPAEDTSDEVIRQLIIDARV